MNEEMIGDDIRTIDYERLANKVARKAVAMIMTYVCESSCHVIIISNSALFWLLNKYIEVIYEEVVSYIIN